MEGRIQGPASGRLASQLALVVLIVLVLRLPFLNEAVQGDDIYYLYGAQHAQIDPAHPTHVSYVFVGDKVDMRGHPHPPLDVWYLAALIALFHDVREVPFHAAYILFSLIAAVSALSIARRFTPHPLFATALFLVTPAFVVNGTSFESDLPFVAFWLASIALFVYAVDKRSMTALAFSCVAMALAALSAYQAIVLVPILLLYGRRWKPAWVAAMTIPVVLAGWQLYERMSSGALPASQLAGYLSAYGFQAAAQKLKSAVALIVHLGWLVFPALTFVAFGRRMALLLAAGLLAAIYDHNPLFWISVMAGVAVVIWCAEHWREFLAQWILIFFAAALVIFFAGSARYLLPIALPVAILGTQRLSPKWLYAGVALEAALSIGLAIVNYQQWSAYHEIARSLAGDAETKRVWINGEWGLRYYLESEGGLPMLRGQSVRSGEFVVSSSLSYPQKFTTAGGIAIPVEGREITSRIPLRLVALNGRSAYSSAGLGLRPFDISTGPIDRVQVQAIVGRTPTLEYLPMNSPEAAQHIAGGIYELENNQYRWMARTGELLLKSPAQATPIKVQLFIADSAPARVVTISLDGHVISKTNFDKPGAYTITTDPVKPAGATAALTITVDKSFSVAGDPRDLGMILTGAGFAK